ncbi:ankyrin repeat domain-containing protein [Wolbachia pipientis]|nr:ankyrin repeat domain-containing protein [Wolbachia pipientis]
MFNSKQVVQHSLFGSNGFKNTLSCEFEGLPEEVSEVINEKSQAIDSLESEREKLLQENCDLKRSIDSQKHYQEIAQEYDEEVSLLTKEKQIIERKIKDSEVKMEKLQNEIYKVQEENEELKQQVKKLDAELQIRNFQIHLLNQELKDKKDEIYFMNTANEKLNKDLDQDEVLMNQLKKKKKQLEDLVENFTKEFSDGNKDLSEIEHLRSYLNKKTLENQNLIRELSILQKENDDLKSKLLYLQQKRSLLDELSESNIKVDRFNQKENGYDKSGYNQKEIYKEDELLDKGYDSFDQRIESELSTRQEYSEIGNPETETTESPVDSYYEFIKEGLLWADRSLIDDKKYLEDLVDEWFIHSPNLKLEESQKKLNQALLNSILKDFNLKNYYSFSNLKHFLESNEKNEDLRHVLNLKRGHLGTTILNVFLEYDEVIPSLLKAGADLNMQDNKGKTLLHDTAIYSSGYEDLGYLLDAKADPNIQDEKGNTPLHYYAAKCSDQSRKTMDLLISKGADLSIKNNDGKTPLQVAIDNDNIIGCLLTNSQKKLREQLGKMLLATSSDEDWDNAYDPEVENLRKFLNQYENDNDLKIVLNVKDDSSVLLDSPSRQFPNVKALLLKAGAADFIGKKQDNYEKCDSFLSEIYQINYLAKRNEFLSKVVKAKSMIELQEVVNEVISSGIRLNLAKDEEYYCTDEILEKIVQLGENYEIASNIVCTLISRGAKLKRLESLKVIDTIELKFKAHKANMISAHLEYVSNTEEFFRIAKAATSGQLYDGKIDNNVSYLEYSEDSIIDVARITDRTRNLELIQESYRRDIIKIGKSEVEIITENGIRYYTDLTEGSSIVLTFYTSLGNIDVRLYPDVQDKSKIIVEVSNREEILEKFKGREEELGNDCGLGEYWVYYAIKRGYFERSGKLMHSESISQSNEKTPLTKLDKIIGVSSFKETVSRCI